MTCVSNVNLNHMTRDRHRLVLRTRSQHEVICPVQVIVFIICAKKFVLAQIHERESIQV